MWDYQEIDDKQKAVMDMTAEQRAQLTWEDAAKFVPFDTICMAVWQGENERRTATPYRALCHVLCIKTTEDAPSVEKAPPAPL